MAKGLDPGGDRALAVKCDVGEEAAVKEAVTKTVCKFVRIDILVNNSGITTDAMFYKMSSDDGDAVFRINLGGAFNLCREVIPKMREQNYGRIVNVVSISAIGGAIGQANYVAAKAVVIGLTKTLAKEGGVNNITVNCSAPGYVDNDMIKTMSPEVLAKSVSQVPMKRVGQPEEIASVASFQASDDACCLTGEWLSVSGGLVV